MKGKPLGLLSMDTVAPEAVRWLWRERIPFGKVTIIQGDPGIGKSTITLDLASRVSRGSAMPDDTATDLPGPQSSLLFSAEDGIADTVRSRLEAMGADLTRISVPAQDECLTLPAGIQRLHGAAVSVQAKLIVIDPLACFLDANVNSWKNQDVRRALAPLAAMAAELCAAVVIVDHLNKRSGVSAIQRGSGSIGIAAAARSVLLVAKNPDDAERCVLVSVKSNLGAHPAALLYETAGAENGGSMIRWLGECEFSANELVAPYLPKEASPKLKRAVDFLRERLKDGGVLSNVVEEDAKVLGISPRTLARARKDLHVLSQPLGKQGEWVLSLPLAEAFRLH